MRNPYFFWLLTIFSVVNIVDVATAFFILPAEANPIYLLTGSYIVLFVLKILLVVVLPWWFYYKHTFPNNFTYYTIVLLITLGTMITGIAAYSNIYAMGQPEAVAAAADIPTGEKIAVYSRVISLLFVLPFAFSMLAFWIYDKSIKYVDIKKPDKWWKI